MNINQLKDSQFLKKEDCGAGILLTIKGDVTQEDVSMDGEDPKLRYALHFAEVDQKGQPIKPMVLNATNAAVIAVITGSEDTADWHGHKVVLFSDSTIMFKGKVMGGIRVRAPKDKAAAAIQPKPPTHDVPSPPPRPVSVTPKQAVQLAPADEDETPF